LEVRRQESESPGLVFRDFLETGPNSWRGVPLTAAQTRLSDLGIAADSDAASRIQEELATEIAGYSKIKVGAVERYAGQHNLPVRLERDGIGLVAAAEVGRHLATGTEGLV
jgi:hypothetical protein